MHVETTPDGSVVSGLRRFTCLTPRLVRMEFSPTGVFEERRSMVAYAPRAPRPFASVTPIPGGLCLETGGMTLDTREHDRAFFPQNLEVRWAQHGLMQYWRPGDRDSRNLGGTLFSLDRVSPYAGLTGVHVADEASPDTMGLRWTGGIFDLEDPRYYAMTGQDAVKARVDAFDFHGTARHRPDDLLTHTLNNMRDQYAYPPGILSESGYFLLNDSLSAVLDADGSPVERNTPGTQDWYFFCYGDDYPAALRDFVLLTGRAPLPAKRTFGLAMCRWPAYSDPEARALVTRCREEGMALSTMIIDMEWHHPGWCNWDWSAETYPDPEGFLAWCHAQEVQVALNVHPQYLLSDDSHFAPFVAAADAEARVETAKNDGTGEELRKIEVDVCDPVQARAFMEICHTPIIRQGVDFWWLDGYKGHVNGTHEQLVANKLYYENAEQADKRGMLLSRYGGVGSHRYGAFFTGDTLTSWEVLGRLCEFNIRAGHIGVAYVSHDTGGFVHPETPLIDPQLFIRWLEFGVFNPILRFHAAPGSGSRHPWDYGAANLAIARKWLGLRNSLLPYIYGAARQHHDTGLPIVRGLFLQHPTDRQAYRFDEFYFGDALLVAPVLTRDRHRQVYLPEGTWYDFATGERVAGGQEFFTVAALDHVPVYVKAGSVLPRSWSTDVPATPHVEHLLLDVYPGDGDGTLYEDDGLTHGYQTGACVRTRFTVRDDGAVTVAGHRPEGEPQGDTRRIRLRVALDGPPVAVTVNGTVLTGDYDPATRRYTLDLPVLPARDGWCVRIDR